MNFSAPRHGGRRGRYAGNENGNVYALRASDGRRLWEFSTGGLVESQITVADGTVCFGSHDSETVYALPASDGLRLWSVTMFGVTGIAVAGRTAYVGR